MNPRGDANWRAVAEVLVAALPAAAERPAADAAQRRLANFWRRRLGEAAVWSWPLLFASGRLVVFVESAAWGQEIRHRAPSLLAELARRGLNATSITVKTRPPADWPPPRKTRPRFHLSAASAAHLESAAATIGHPRLAQAMRSLAQRAESPETPPSPLPQSLPPHLLAGDAGVQ